ncbi:MAG: hypothetical protein R6V10_15220 [bacterium]
MSYSTIPKRLQDFASKWVPGLKTYLQREGLRDADKLIRDELVERLDKVRKALDKAKARRVDRGSLKNLDKLDRATRKIEKVRDTIKYDSRGYRGVFDPEEVAENQLAALIDFDTRLFEFVDVLDQEVEKVVSLADDQLQDALYEFEEKVEGLHSTLGEREQYSTGNLPQPQK